MKIFNTRPLLRSILFSAMSLTFGFFINACKPKDPPATSEEKEAPHTQISLLQQQAQEVIENDPNVELVEVIGEKLHIQNKYTKRALTLPFQMIIDGHYQMIQEDKKLAESILRNQEANQKKAQPHPLSMQSEGWGKTPTWIPRYPDIKLSPSKIHAPREDGSVWGQISGTHTESIEEIKGKIISEFEKSGLKLTRNFAEKDSVSMIFENSHTVEDESQERRKVNCTISKLGDKTQIAIQYSYGM